MFGDALGHRAGLSRLLIVLGVLTAVVGAIYCLRERHLKRLLAFSTISHSGMILAAIGALSPLGLAGAAVYVVGHALVKAALFLCTGIVLHRLGTVDETRLHGRGRGLRVTGIVYIVAGLGLADLPPLANFLGEGWTDAALPGWAVVLLLCCVALTAGAVLRAGFGVFFGLGDAPGEDRQQEREAAEETGETDTGRQRTPLTMIVPAAVLAAAAIAVGVLGWSGLGATVEAAAVRFQDQAGYISTVLAGRPVSHPVAPFPATPADVTLTAVVTGLATTAGAMVIALLALYRRRLPLGVGLARRVGLAGRVVPRDRAVALAEGFQSGVVNDYVTWLVLGLACLGGLLALIVR
jgi:multicomponent Na+:H+ antiporter subunit D